MIRQEIDDYLQRENIRMQVWQVLVVILLVAGYSGYYLCRSNLSVTMPLIVKDMVRDGYDPQYARVALGWVASLGVFIYAIGKFISGGLTDFLGGKKTYLGGMLASVVFTMMFSLSGSVPLFSVTWMANRFVQSLGWVGIVKITSRWFSYSSYGSVMGIISLSYLFGDAAARAFMGWLLYLGIDWRGVFVIAATCLLAIFGANWLLLKESPTEIGEPEPRSNPDNVYAEEGEQAQPEGLLSLLRPLFRNRDFLFVCAMSLGMTLLRETFNTWTPTYYNEVIGLSEQEAASWSALFPLFGGFSVVLAGFASDRLGRGGRSLLLFLGLLVSAAGLVALAQIRFEEYSLTPILLTSAIAFAMIGPYSYLGGALALDFGGKRGSATACGIIDGVGYLGGVLAGGTFARASVAFGWGGAYGILASVALLTCIPALLMYLDDRERVRQRRLYR